MGEAAIQIASERPSAFMDRVKALLPDGGERYLSTSLFVSETVPEPLRFYNTLSGKTERLDPLTSVDRRRCRPRPEAP